MGSGTEDLHTLNEVGVGFHMLIISRILRGLHLGHHGVVHALELFLSSIWVLFAKFGKHRLHVLALVQGVILLRRPLAHTVLVQRGTEGLLVVDALLTCHCLSTAGEESLVHAKLVTQTLG